MSRPVITEEARNDAIQRVRDGAPAKDLARRLGVKVGTVRAWVRLGRAPSSTPDTYDHEAPTANAAVCCWVCGQTCP